MGHHRSLRDRLSLAVDRVGHIDNSQADEVGLWLMEPKDIELGAVENRVLS